MIITTSGKPTSEIIAKAKQLSIEYGIPYKPRHGISIKSFKNQYLDDTVVVGSDKIIISPLSSNNNVFFHPNLAIVRAKRVLKGEHEPLLSTAKLKEGMSFLDCTLGLASDSIIASLAVGDTGKVIGIEGNEMLSFLVKEGLRSFQSGNSTIDQAMRRISVFNQDHLFFLKNQPTNSIDVVYFDPMFQEAIDTSNGIDIIKEHTIMADISHDIITEAKRVAIERVILKDHWKSNRFAQYGFTQFKRKTSLFHYGSIEVTE
ncbi:class I SAM-dependent methyltransferase [Ornithinibacillus scapharcae]|uniref:class I SAM-dependent methyltransferase n=1 Tax=Ornithinibacillus scapharcae TaxID=1147159 RepID=UPI000225ACFF|nr:class I SAM-dependent methyltransferase [Ornithinibacillus scapharcae]